MLDKIASRNTNHLRRAALQITLQLPENVAEARRVLDLADDLLEDFLIAAPRELRQLAPADRAIAPRPLFLAMLTIAAAAALTPIAASAAWLLDADVASASVFAAGLSVVALTLGSRYGVLFAALAALAHNFAVIAPAFHCAPPSETEIIRLIGWVATAILLPRLAAGATRLRQWLLSGVVRCDPAVWSPGRPAGRT